MRLVIGLLIVSSLVSDGLAAAVRVELRATPVSAERLQLTPRVVRQTTATGDVHRPIAPALRAADVLNCENDNLIAPSTTLKLLPGDMAGNIFELGLLDTPRVIESISLGMLPQPNSSFPLLVYLDIFVYDPVEDSFVNVAPFDITIDSPIDPAGEILDIDLSKFGVEVGHDLLTLYGDATNTTVDKMVNPAGDDSPRCLSAGGDNVCSVLLPFDDIELFIYGVDDAGCASGIMNFDLVHEVSLAPVVATETASWSSVKARF